MQIAPAWFWPYSLRQAEEELLGACLDHESALDLALELLPLDDFRTQDDLRRIFYVLVGWRERGVYDPGTNRARLTGLFTEGEGEGTLESLWCPWGMNRDYVTALCQAITQSNKALDLAVAAEKHWREVRLTGEDRLVVQKWAR